MKLSQVRLHRRTGTVGGAGEPDGRIVGASKRQEQSGSPQVTLRCTRACHRVPVLGLLGRIGGACPFEPAGALAAAAAAA